MKIQVKVLGWEKINARKDVDNPSWFKFKHSFFSDSEFYDFSFAEKVCWFYILCEASKKNKQGNVQLCTEHCFNNAKLDQEVVTMTLKKLHRLQIVEFSTSRRRHANVTSAGVRQEERREEKNRKEERREEESPERSEKRIETVVCYFSLDEIFQERSVNEKMQAGWVKAFPDDAWVVGEIQKALAWEIANPSRRKKNFSAFITRWLTKGWDQRKTPVATSGQNFAQKREAGNLNALEAYKQSQRGRDESA